MSELIVHYGYALVFLNVLIQQLGAPLPVTPTLVVAGALAASGEMSAAAILGVSVLASAVSDALWYLAGNRHGTYVLRILRRFARKPEAFVSRTQRRFARWGLYLLLVAKFVPGLSLVMPALAGSMNIRFIKFMTLDVLGASLWAGSAIALGVLLHDDVDSTLARLQQLEMAAAIAVCISSFVVVAVLFWRHHQSTRPMSRQAPSAGNEESQTVHIAV